MRNENKKNKGNREKELKSELGKRNKEKKKKKIYHIYINFSLDFNIPMLQTVLEPAIVALGPYRHGGLLWYWDHSDIGAYLWHWGQNGTGS